MAVSDNEAGSNCLFSDVEILSIVKVRQLYIHIIYLHEANYTE